MRKIFFLIVFVCINHALLAQSKSTDSSLLESRRVALLLQLSSDQEKQIYAIHRHFIAQRKNLITQRLGREALIDSLRKNNDLKIKLYRTVFRKAQYDLYVDAKTRNIID